MNLEKRTRYPKMIHLWKRFENPPEMRGIMDRNKFSAPEFGAIDSWHVTEKIDGVNIRVMLRLVNASWTVTLFTREGTDQNINWPGAKAFLVKTFTTERIFQVIDIEKLNPDTTVVLYGEMFGPKIWGGVTYSDTIDYALFDVRIDDWWLETKVVEEMAEKMGIRYVPIIAETASLKYIEGWVEREGVESQIGSGAHAMEGVVCRANPMMLFRNNKNPIQFKLKFKEIRKTLEWEASNE